MNDWVVQLKKGLLEYIVLGILNKRKLYGRDLIELLNKSYIETGEGTIYPLLAKLRINKFVTSILEESNKGPARKYYILTELGKSRFNNMKLNYEEFNKKIYKLINN